MRVTTGTSCHLVSVVVTADTWYLCTWAPPNGRAAHITSKYAYQRQPRTARVRRAPPLHPPSATAHVNVGLRCDALAFVHEDLGEGALVDVGQQVHAGTAYCAAPPNSQLYLNGGNTSVWQDHRHLRVPSPRPRRPAGIGSDSTKAQSGVPEGGVPARACVRARCCVPPWEAREGPAAPA